MLLVDERIGSRDLLGPLNRYGVPADLAHLDFGDFAFIGKGIDGADVFIGIELKESRDVVSSMLGGRFAGHQLYGLAMDEHKIYDRAWLLTEGMWKQSDDGVLLHYTWDSATKKRGWFPVQVGTRAIMYNDLESWILTQTIRGGLSYWHCQTRQDTIRFIATLYHWWVDKELQQHRSHQAIYLPPPDKVMMSPPSEMLKMLAGIDGVGWDKGRAIENHFGKWGRFNDATLKQLIEVPGVGKVIAKHIREVLA